MSDDRIRAALGRLADEDLAPAADRMIRARLETAWTARRRPILGRGFGTRRFAPALAAFVLLLGFGGSALGAGADSPLWDTRVALESAGAFLRLSTDDRVAYLLDLVRSRTEEAARQEAAGHPGAAAKARAAVASAVLALDGHIPQIEAAAVPVPSASATSSPANSPSPSAVRSASGSPAAQLPAPTSPTPTHTVAPTVLRTEPVRTPSPTPKPTASPAPKQLVTITGTVHNADGTNASNACITTSPTVGTSCMFLTKNGSYGFSAQLTPGQSITLYAYLTDATGVTYGGYATATATAPTTIMPTITLTLRR